MQNNPLFDLFCLLSSALNGKKPEDISSVDLQGVYDIARYHSLVFAVYYAIEPYLSGLDDKELLGKWRLETKEHIFKQLEFDVEREAVTSFLSSVGCWYMPLKGSVLKELYVNPAMRDMGDVDILFDEGYAGQLREFMTSRGYDSTVGIGKDDIYKKPPFYIFEMHRQLIDSAENAKLAEYYKNVRARLVESGKKPCELRFTDEDFYIYLIAHEYQHYSGNGLGLRAIVDAYVYLNAKKAMNRKYIDAELKKLGMTEFEEIIRSLAVKLLSYPQQLSFTEAELSMLEYTVNSGTYGNRNIYIENDLKAQFGDGELTRLQKLKYFFGRIFLSKEFMKSKYPWIRKHPWLLPFGYLHRIFVRGIHESDRLKREAKTVWKK